MQRTKVFLSWSLSSWLLLGCGLSLYALLRLHQGLQPNAMQTTTAWLTLITLFLACCHQLDREANDARPFTLAWNRFDTLALIPALLLAFVLRVVNLQQIPLAMHNDEAAMAIEGMNVLAGSLSDPFAIGWYSHPSLWFYLVAFSLRLFGETLVGARMLSVLVGTAAIGATYLLARLWFNRRVAVLAAFLLAGYHFHIHFSRIALNNVVDPTLGPLICCCLWIAICTGRSLWFGLSGVLLGLSLYFYMGTRLFLLLVLALGVIWLLTQRPPPARWRPLWPSLLIMLAGFLFVTSPLLQTFYRAPDLFLSRTRVVVLNAEWIAKVLSERDWTITQFFWDQLQNTLLLFFNRPDTSDFYDQQHPLLQGLGAGLTILGLLITLLQLRHWPYQVLLLWALLALSFGGLLMITPRMAQRYVTLTPVICLWMALALDELAANSAELWPQRKLLVNFAAALLVIYLSVNSVRQYFFDYIPRETFGNFSSQAATTLGRYLQSQPTGTVVWFLGESWISYSGFPILRFHAPQVTGHDLREPFTAVAAPPTPGNAPTLYVAVPNRRDELNLVQAAFPGGQLQPLYWPKQAEPALYLYTVGAAPADSNH